MTEYEEITNNKTTDELVTELAFQLNGGWNISDSFPQNIIECIHKLNPTKNQYYLKFETFDFWSRPVYKLVNKQVYIGSIEHLFPDKNVSETNDTKEINAYFRKHLNELCYFGTVIDDDPLGKRFSHTAQLIILD